MVVFGAVYVKNGAWRGGGGDILSFTYITMVSPIPIIYNI